MSHNAQICHARRKSIAAPAETKSSKSRTWIGRMYAPRWIWKRECDVPRGSLHRSSGAPLGASSICCVLPRPSDARKSTHSSVVRIVLTLRQYYLVIAIRTSNDTGGVEQRKTSAVVGKRVAEEDPGTEGLWRTRPSRGRLRWSEYGRLSRFLVTTSSVSSRQTRIS